MPMQAAVVPAPARTYQLTQTPEARLASLRWWRPFGTVTQTVAEPRGNPEERQSYTPNVPPRIWQPFGRTSAESEVPVPVAYAESNAPSQRVVTRNAQVRVAAVAPADGFGAVGPTSSNALAALGGGSLMMIAEARKYVGLTGAQLNVVHRGAWCGEFMGRVARATGVKTPNNPNMAPDWSTAGTRISGPRVGAIALVSRGRGIGHVGLVTGVNESGDPIIISGNHNNRVVEIAYPRRSIAAYVWPGGS
jgi:uncharacterized protein (TIGR02594 family)